MAGGNGNGSRQLRQNDSDVHLSAVYALVVVAWQIKPSGVGF
jgi:hypothetical protein